MRISIERRENNMLQLLGQIKVAVDERQVKDAKSKSLVGIWIVTVHRVRLKWHQTSVWCASHDPLGEPDIILVQRARNPMVQIRAWRNATRLRRVVGLHPPRKIIIGRHDGVWLSGVPERIVFIGSGLVAVPGQRGPGGVG